MISVPRKFEQWLKALIAAVITGGANAGLTALGTTVANTVNPNIQPLNWDQLKVTLLSGAFVGALAYLAKSPVPPDDATDNTEQKPTV